MITVKTAPVVTSVGFGSFGLRPILLSISVVVSMVVGIASLSGCRLATPIPKEGDVVTWKHSSELIIKAKLGQRREHVIADARTDHLFYEPEYEKFIGQFPIDYNPKPFPKFTEQERVTYETEKRNKKLPPYKSLHPIQFNLMLNGIKAKATDTSPVGGSKGMDDPNQVKVFLHGHGTKRITTKSGVKRAYYNTQQFFELDLMERLDVSSKETKHGLDCYRFNDKRGGERCFGNSTHPSVSGFRFYVSPFLTSTGAKSNILVRSQEFIYGGIEIQWFTDQKNMYRSREIDAAIWRLLAAWNISPLTKPTQNND